MTEERAMKNVTAAQRKYDVLERRYFQAMQIMKAAKYAAECAEIRKNRAYEVLLAAHNDLHKFEK